MRLSSVTNFTQLFRAIICNIAIKCKAAPLKATAHMRAVSNLEKFTISKKTKYRRRRRLRKDQRRVRKKAAYLRVDGIKGSDGSDDNTFI